MAAESNTSTEHELPSTEEYEQETSEVRIVELPVMDFTLPIYQRPPGRLMTAMEDFGLGGLFGPGDVDIDDMLDDDGNIGINTFMRTDVVPNVVVQETNKDAVHWKDDDLRDDPDVDDFDLSVLKDEDLAALIQGMMVGSDDDVEDQLDKFQ